MSENKNSKTNNIEFFENIETMLTELKQQIFEIKLDLNTIKNKMSMPNGIIQIKKAKFFLPYYPADCIQRYIVDNQTYWFTYDLEIIDKWLPDNAVILDIGANIGSYSLYWALERNAKKIYAFEPLKDIYNILSTNIKLNNLQKTIKTFNIGLSNKKMMASIDNFQFSNIGGTSFKESNKGSFPFKELDSIKFKEHIDVIKIDVEGNEIDVLDGAMKTIENNHPLIIIESFANKEKVDKILTNLGYEMVEAIHEEADFIYKYQP